MQRKKQQKRQQKQVKNNLFLEDWTKISVLASTEFVYTPNSKLWGHPNPLL